MAGRGRELRQASKELQRAGTEGERLEAIDRQLRALFALAGVGPVPRDQLPSWLWDAAWARDAIAGELAAPGAFTAWRLGWWARLLPLDERAPVVDLALDAFERLLPTPIGPGNDAGPFCDLAPELSLAQTRRALGLAQRMHAAGWGPEAANGIMALAKRLVALGQPDEAAPLLAQHGDLDAPPARPPQGSASEPSLRSYIAAWTSGLFVALAQLRESDGSAQDPFLGHLTSPRTARLLRGIAGSAAIELCRGWLVGERA